MYKLALSLSLIILLLSSCQEKETFQRQRLDLSGQWQFSLDSLRTGIMEQWYLMELGDSIQLPGTTDSNHKGYLNKDTSLMHLNRVYSYEGPAWYQKTLEISPDMLGKQLVLVLERSRSTRIWLDDTFVGYSHILQTPQRYDLTEYLDTGKHRLSICVDNSLHLTPYGNVHIYTDETQTNWNGIIGDIYLEAVPKTHIADLQVYPDPGNGKAKIRLVIENSGLVKNFDIDLQISRILDGKRREQESMHSTQVSSDTIWLEYAFEKDFMTWEEWQPAYYELRLELSNGKLRDAKTVPFGMRNFYVEGTQFKINDKTTFLRGKHDAAVFPMTGYTPMDVESWKRVYRIAKSYGINHYRFHSYCPPDAAFTAADEEGIYLQAETPFWGGLDTDTLAKKMRDEGMAMLKEYANHPSFVMFSHGNEIWSGHDRVEANLKAFKTYDSRPLYTMGSNNSIGYLEPSEMTEFFVAARTPSAGDTILTHTRLTHAFADSREGASLNSLYPSTETNFDYPVSVIDVPIISHEIGQYQVYPDYNEIEKYTGVLRARNLEVFRDRLEKAGMLELDGIFQKASGAWSALCYKAEMEAAFRTEGFGGFQLLDLQDFPGQGTALVGILDAFMDSKEVISPEDWRASCNDLVILLEMPKYTWTSNEEYTAEIKVANYSAQNFSQNIRWELRDENGKVVTQQRLNNLSVPQGRLLSVGRINIELSEFSKASRLNLSLSASGNDYSNSYPLWVYPVDSTEIQSDGIVETDNFNTLKNKLAQGQSVLYYPDEAVLSGRSIPGLFPPDFWNWGMFKGISERIGKPVSPGTLGLLMYPEHPAFNDFPTDFHTNWQWFSIVKSSAAFILDSLPGDYQPIVRVIDNLERNHSLGMIFEFKVGEGKLLVCTSPLPDLGQDPVARQLHKSLLQYMSSEDFKPELELSPAELEDLFAGPES